MVIRIFRTQKNLRESWLAVNDDGTVSHHLRNFGSRLLRDGAEERTRTISASEAKSRWPLFSESINLAVAEVCSCRHERPSGLLDDTLANRQVMSPSRTQL